MSDYVAFKGTFKVLTKGKVTEDYLKETCKIWDLDYSKVRADFEDGELEYLDDKNEKLMYLSSKETLIIFPESYEEDRDACEINDLCEISENTFRVNTVFYNGGTYIEEVIEDLL